MKQILTNYVFVPSTGKITFSGILDFDARRILSIINQTTNVIIYGQSITGKGMVTSDSESITLAYDTSAMSSTDQLTIIYSDFKATVGNAQKKFRDNFAISGTQPNPTVWDLSNPDSHLVEQGGDTLGSSYLKLSLSPFLQDSEVSITSKEYFTFPLRAAFGISQSQRIIGQETAIELVGIDSNNVVETITPVADKAITGATISITTNVATVTLTNHGYKGGERVVIYGCPERRLNVGPVVVTVLTANTFTVPCTLANGSYSSVGGYIKRADHLNWALNGAGIMGEIATVTTSTLSSRRNGSAVRYIAGTTASVTATQTNTSPYSDSFNPTGIQQMTLSLDDITYRSWAADGVATMSGLTKFSSTVPEETGKYKIRIRAKNLKNFSIPVATILSIAKTGTTTATVTTNADHGLVAGDYVQVLGVRDQTNFPNLVSTIVGTVPTSTTFTIIIGTATTTSSLDGFVFKNEGSVSSNVYAGAIQSISRTSNILTVIGSATWATPLPGETVHIYGLTAAAVGYEGAYKVLRVSTTTLELQSIGEDFGSIATGGAIMKRTDFRIHFARLLDYTRLTTEISGGQGSTTDINASVPVSITGSATLGASVTQSTAATISATTGLGGWYIHQAIVGLPDIASAAITTTTTTASIANNLGNAFQVVIPVTVASGTNPTLDIRIEESFDSGTNWVTLYEFQRITATGHYFSPVLKSVGRNIRYVQTISGTTPSFTRSITRNILPFQNAEPQKRIIDRSIVLTTLNSVTPTLFQGAGNNVQLIVNVGAITTTAPDIQLEGSEDNSNWYAVGTPLTAVASSTVQLTVNNLSSTFLRARVSTAGVGVTAGYVAIKSWS